MKLSAEIDDVIICLDFLVDKSPRETRLGIHFVDGFRGRRRGRHHLLEVVVLRQQQADLHLSGSSENLQLKRITDADERSPKNRNDSDSPKFSVTIDFDCFSTNLSSTGPKNKDQKTVRWLRHC